MDKLFSNLQNTATNMTKMVETKDTSDTTKDSEKLLQKQQNSTEKLSALLEQSLNVLNCGPDCQKEKISKELKKKYEDAETNLQTAPVQLETSKKHYYVFTEGRSFYNDMLEKE